MIRLFYILIATAVIIACGNLYFEYCVNREIEDLLQMLVTIAMIVFAFAYFKFTINQITKLLKLKK